MTTSLAAKIAREYGTPCAVIDMDRVERNIARIQAACDAAGVANRPHIKTHKSPMLAQMQIKAGAKGITCQKLGEAEIMADAGIDDILISYNLIGDEKMARLGALQAKANMTVAADNSIVIAGLPQGRRGLGPSALGRGRMRHRAQARRRRNAGRGDRAGARDRSLEGADVRRLHAVSDRDRLGRCAEVLRRGVGRRARPRAGCHHGLDRRHAEPRRISASSRAPPSIAPAPTSTTTACRSRPASPPGTIARCTSIPPWSAAPRPSAAFSMPAPRR